MIGEKNLKLLGGKGKEGIIVPKLTPCLAGQVQYKVNDRTSKLHGPSFVDLFPCKWSEFFDVSQMKIFSSVH